MTTVPTQLFDIAFNDLSWAFLDLETTGRHPARDQIIEIAILRDAYPAVEPHITLNTLVRPEPHRRIGNREIHGITNRDIRRAPTFKRVAGLLVDALAGCVVVAHNAVFDMEFLMESFSRIGVKISLPHICTLELRRLLGFKGPHSLDDLAIVNGIKRSQPYHQAIEDASIARRIFWECLEFVKSKGKSSLRDLYMPNGARFFRSLTRPVLNQGAFPQLRREPNIIVSRDKLRLRRSLRSPHPLDDSYQQGLQRALDTHALSADILTGLLQLRKNERLEPERWRAIHAVELGKFLQSSVSSGVLDEIANIRIRQAMEFLSALGWMPGDK